MKSFARSSFQLFTFRVFNKLREVASFLVPEFLKNLIYSIWRSIRDHCRLFLEIIAVRLQTNSNPSKACHVLICRNREYLTIAKFAISSFLKFNQDYQVIAHFDASLFQKSVWLKVLFPKSRLSVVQDISDIGYPYVLKGKLLLSLQGSSDVFLDADTRSNGPLPKIIHPLTLVAEFKMGDNINFRNILEAMNLHHLVDYFLLNVSVVSWAGKDLEVSNEEFDDWCTAYLSLNWLQFLQPDQVPYFKRFVEQVFFSIIFQRGEYQTLKDSDRVGDGGIVECSYFGASGYRFGR